MMDDLSEQIDEIGALVAIYGKDWQTDDEENRIYSIEVGSDNKVAKLYIKLPKNYPSTASPSYEMSAPHLSLAQKNRLTYLMDELVEKVREELESGLNIPQESEIENQSETGECNSVLVTKLDSDDEFECPDIVHGEVIVDRKSSFQGHAAVVISTKQVKQVLHMLYENKKIKQATHNMYAYRISRDGISNFIQDCEDDGESQAGGRLLHLLQIMEAKDVMVVVSRWYGGVHLGPDRFRHINNAARQVLTAGNFLPDKTKKKL